MLPMIKLLEAVSSSSESPSLKAGLSEDQVSPGFLGFLLTFFVVALTAFLIVDMVRRIRRVRYRAQVAGELVEPGFGEADSGAEPVAGAAGAPNEPDSGDHGPRRH